MKIILMDLKAIGNEDVITAFSHLRDRTDRPIEVVRYPFENTPDRTDPIFEERFLSALMNEKPDAVFSFNFYPLISLVCNRSNTPYIAFVYDSPHIALYSYTAIFPCNHIYVFDSAVAEAFEKQGIKTITYLPLAAGINRLDAMMPAAHDHNRFDADVAFVGGLYTEGHTFYDRMEPLLDDYTRGYLEAVMNAQKLVSGINFIEKRLTPPILDNMSSAYPMPPNADGVETQAWIYAQYMLSRKITQSERTELLQRIGSTFGTDHTVALYTRDADFSCPGIENRGRIDYYNEMPYAFKCAKINLNISLRSIERGIPQRALDIMAAGGFLLTNIQPDLFGLFEPDTDFVYYENTNDLISKIAYYLDHDSDREAIAKNGHDKIASRHTWEIRLHQILEDIFGEY